MTVTLVLTVVALVVLGVVMSVVLLVLVTVALAGSVRALLWDGEVIDTFVEVFTVDMLVGVLIIIPNVDVDLLMCALSDIMLNVLTNIGVDVLVGVNVNVLAGIMAALELAMTLPLKVFGC